MQQSRPRNRILFLCVANSARSQMAEGIARRLAHGGVEVFSAGSEPTTVNPLAVVAMARRGIDISSHRSKSVDDVPLGTVDTVITLCDEEFCPDLGTGVDCLHWPLMDPAGVDGSEEDRLAAFESVADELHRRLTELMGSPVAEVSSE